MQDAIYQEIGGEIGRALPGPLYMQIARRLAERVERGELVAGQPLPPQRRLCKMLGVGEVTARRALRRLADEGVLAARQGSGTVVAGRRPSTLEYRRPGRTRRQPFRLGIVCVGSTDGYPFIQPHVKSIEQAGRAHPLTEHGLNLQMLFVPERLTSEAAVLQRVPLERFDGLVMMSPINVTLLAACQRTGRAYVLLFNDLADGVSACISVDFGPGMLDAVTHLRRLGRARFALVTSHADRFSSGQMVAAFRVALRANGLSADAAHIIPAGYHHQQSFEATQALLSEHSPPDAILYASAHQAQAGIMAIEQTGLNPRHDVSLVAVGVDDPSSTTELPLAWIDIGLAHMTEAVFAGLLQATTNPSGAALRHIITSRFVPCDP